ncbi:MAG: hypothetical protein BWK73_33275 [Thiothrix lacustris]|uniref:Uncharacterized protein n=1 Tax=Thiothrix lacustris TaxID=525917 RepID=A0A1Y1QH44_9GAMM|nr:MAG: hypothetical protein BWK73_33275 [Thiothrix lacustris]
MAFKSNYKVWFWKPFGVTLIWVYSLIKILLFLVLYLNSDFYYELMEEQNAGLIAIGLAVLAVVMYIWVAVNHTYHTGYYLAYRWHHSQSERAFSKYIHAISAGAVLNNKESATIKQKYQAQSRPKTIDLGDFCRLVSQVDVPEFRSFQQQGRTNNAVKQCLESGLVEQEIDGLHSLVKIQGRENTWQLTCHGLFKDEQLDKIVKAQPTELAKLAVAYYGHSIQMDSVNL